jgi:hypothetical protein
MIHKDFDVFWNASNASYKHDISNVCSSGFVWLLRQKTSLDFNSHGVVVGSCFQDSISCGGMYEYGTLGRPKPWL